MHLLVWDHNFVVLVSQRIFFVVSRKISMLRRAGKTKNKRSRSKIDTIFSSFDSCTSCVKPVAFYHFSLKDLYFILYLTQLFCFFKSSVQLFLYNFGKKLDLAVIYIFLLIREKTFLFFSQIIFSKISFSLSYFLSEKRVIEVQNRLFFGGILALNFFYLLFSFPKNTRKIGKFNFWGFFFFVFGEEKKSENTSSSKECRIGFCCSVFFRPPKIRGHA